VTPGAPRNNLTKIALLLLLLRLLSAALLLPPWAGFDEPYHHGYARESAARPAWPRFREILLPDGLVQEIRQWPLPDAYARDFAGRRYGAAALPPWNAFQGENYETQQSPLYYFLAGRALAVLPALSGIEELYLLRLLNAFCAFLVGVLIGFTARAVGFGERSWMPVAFVALVPEYALALCRVSNDALCALLVAAALAGTLPVARKSSKREVLGCLAGGLAPWAKLYGVVVFPSLCWRSFRARPAARRAALVVLWSVPLLLLAFFSWRIHGHILPLQENLLAAPAAPLLDVPWLRGVWTIAKTHVWFSGMSFLVFPTWLYLIPVLLIACGFVLTVASVPAAGRAAREKLVFLLVPFMLFWAALAYHAWRSFSLSGAPGGTGGWYLWGAALPEALMVLWGVALWPKGKPWALAGLGLFLLLSVLGDIVLFASSTGRVLTKGAGHVTGISPASLDVWLGDFLATRPRAAAIGALLCVALSWIVAILLIGKRRNGEEERS